MRDIPDCLNRRYQALDELIRELSEMSHQSCHSGCPASEPGVKLMCEFWNILKEDPNCNLPQQVHQCLCPPSEKCSFATIPSQRITCFMANEDKAPENRSEETRDIAACCTEASKTPSKTDPPLSKVLGNLKKAATYDKDCNQKLKELLAAEKHLRGQIAHLEGKEKDGINLLKEADDMWNSMEEAYKQKIAQSLERQKELLKELQAIEKSAAKWRKNRKDLESQLESINKCQLEMKQKINQKTNDMKCIDAEIAGFKKRIEDTKKETESVKRSIVNKKQASDARIAKISQEISKLETQVQEESKLKKEKEKEGNGFIKEARDDLQQMCKLLLQKKLETEDLRAERNSLVEETNMLKDSCNMCKDKCKKKQVSLGEEIKKIDTEIQQFKVKCIRCHQCTDTGEARKFCIDCPRCAADRECLIEGKECKADIKEECVCQMIKEKFLDNVFENMYSILEKFIQTKAGKILADEVVDCLKKSRNGKLNERTRRNLQEFILSTVKQNLNLTIVGGAVKTRCEMDNDTYNQLMLCLKQVKPTPPKKDDKGTDVKKDPCARWGGPNECHCPKGPKACVCGKKAPPPPNDLTTCPPDKEDKGQAVKCPHKLNTSCGPECGARPPNNVGADVSTLPRPDPCSGPTCAFGKNMRAAQCVLGPESLTSLAPSSKRGLPRVPSIPVLDNQAECKCGSTSTKTCTCPKDQRTIPRQRIIEEVMGRYVDVSPIEKVSTIYIENKPSDLNVISEDSVRIKRNRSNYSTNTFVNRFVQFRNQPTQNVLEDVWINKPKLIEGSNKNNNIPDGKSKEVTFPEFNNVISSQETFTDINNCELISNATNTITTDEMKLVDKTVNLSRTASGGVGSESSKIALYSRYSSSNFQTQDAGLSISNADLLNNQVKSVWKNYFKRIDNNKDDPTKPNNPSLEWLTVEALLKNLEYEDGISEVEGTELSNAAPKRDAPEKESPRNNSKTKRKVLVLVNKNKKIEEIFKAHETNTDQQVKLIKQILNRRL